jgi:hypothetical protein
MVVSGTRRDWGSHQHRPKKCALRTSCHQEDFDLDLVVQLSLGWGCFSSNVLGILPA